MVLSLDLDDLVEATERAVQLAPYFGIVRVGLELFCASGPESIAAFRERGFCVFADLMLHDTPSSAHKAARVLGAVGASYVTIHAQGGLEMMQAAVEGLYAGSDGAGLERPTALAVTVLPTDTDAPPHIVPQRVRMAVVAGCGGLVCAAADLPAAREAGPELLRVVPGIRPMGELWPDQPRSVTAAEAVEAGADLLVVGRAVLGSPDPIAAAERLFHVAPPAGITVS